VLGVVILIAVTLVGGVATASFAFGLFGSLSTTANVSITRMTCTHGGAAASTCGVYLQNTGDVATTVVSCSLSGGDSTLPYGNEVLHPGTTTFTRCRIAPGATFAGEPVQGTFTLGNGVVITFEGMYS